MHQAWQPLLANMAVIAVFVSIWTSLQSWLQKAEREQVDLVFGTLCGGTGMAVMAMPLEIVPGVVFDLRNVTVVMAGFFSGPVGGIVAGGLTGAFRLWLGGIGTVPGLIEIGVCVASGIILNRRKGHTASLRDVLDLAFATAVASIISIMALPAALHGAIFAQAAMPSVLFTFISVLLSGSAIVHENRRRDIARTNEIYGAVMDALPDCLNAKDADGRFLVANPATAALMGAESKDALIGRMDGDFYDAETAAAFRKDEERVIRWGQAETLEQKFIQRNGKIAWLSTLKVPFPSEDGREIGIITHNRDITIQKELELKLSETQARLSDALTHMADGLVMFGADGRLVYCSERFKKMFSVPDSMMLTGMPLRSILQQAVDHFDIVLPPGMGNAEWIDEELEKVARLKSSEFQLKDGRWFQNRHAAVRDGAWLTVFSDITERKRNEQALIDLNARLEVLARTDGLTGLTNRKTFDERLQAEFARSRRHGGLLGLILTDVDRFKAYNDLYGHPAGDACLIGVAERLKSVARRPSDVVARYGGEEFVAIFPDADAAGMRAIAEQFRKAVRDMNFPHGGSEKSVVTVSVGVAVMAPTSDLHSPADLLRLADEALYSAKDAGRDCVRVADLSTATNNGASKQKVS